MKNSIKTNNQTYKNTLDIAFIFVMLGIILTPIIAKSWIISLIACPFIKNENDNHLFV